MRKKIAASLLAATLVSACHHPERIPTTMPQDSSLNCNQIQMEKRRAEQAKLAAREHDRFEMRYILLIPAAVSLYNFDQAEKAANARLEQLDTLYMQKDCANQPQEATPAPTMPTSPAPNRFPGSGVSPFNPDDTAPEPF